MNLYFSNERIGLVFFDKNCYNIKYTAIGGENMTFSEKVLEVRGHLQITQAQLAELLGVSYSSVNRWEGGHYEATKLVKRRFDDLCKKYGIIFDDSDK